MTHPVVMTFMVHEKSLRPLIFIFIHVSNHSVP